MKSGRGYTAVILLAQWQYSGPLCHVPEHASQLHKKPASTGTFHVSFHAQGHHKMESL